jgi:tetratricopeptide (TPR) repeat protein
MLRRVVILVQKYWGPEHRNVASAMNNLATVTEAMGHFDQAESLLRQSLEIRERAFGPYHSDVGLALTNLGMLYLGHQRYVTAEPLLRRALAVHEKAHGKDHREVISVLVDLARLYRELGRESDARPLLRRAESAAGRTLTAPDPVLAKLYNQMGTLQFQQRNLSGAGKLYDKALAMVRKLYGNRHPEVASTLGNLGQLAKHRGNYREAERYYKDALESLGNLSAFAEKTAIRHLYADLLRETHRSVEADQLETQY